MQINKRGYFSKKIRHFFPKKSVFFENNQNFRATDWAENLGVLGVTFVAIFGAIAPQPSLPLPSTSLSLSIYLSISLGRGRLRKIGVGIELGERQYVFCTVKPPHHPRSFLAPPLHNPHTVTKERGNAGRDETNARTIISVGVGDVGKETGNGEERCSVEESSIAKLKNVGKVSQNRK